MNEKPRYAITTLVTDPGYVPGALVLGRSIERVGWDHESLLLATASVSETDRERLRQYWSIVREVEPIGNPTPRQNRGHAHFETTYTKLHIWNQTEFKRLIFLDADTLVTGKLDELLERGEFAAAPDVTSTDLFNSGVMVLEPSRLRYEEMTAGLGHIASYDGSDQGFLNAFYPDWFVGPPQFRLPMKFNVAQQVAVYGPTWKRMKEDLRVLHFLGAEKPWRIEEAARRRAEEKEKKRRKNQSLWKRLRGSRPAEPAAPKVSEAARMWLDVWEEIENR